MTFLNSMAIMEHHSRKKENGEYTELAYEEFRCHE